MSTTKVMHGSPAPRTAAAGSSRRGTAVAGSPGGPTNDSLTINNAATINVLTPDALSQLIADAEQTGYRRCQEEETIVSKKDLTKLLQVHVRTIDRWVDNSEIPLPKQIGEKYYWTKSDLIEFIRTKV